MRNYKNIIPYGVVAILSLCIGITIGKLFNWNYFIISTELSIIDALNLFTTIGLALYITSVLERKIQTDRIEKDIISSKIAEIEESLTSIHEIIDDDPIKYIRVNSIMHRFGVTRNYLFKELNELNIVTISNTGENLDEIIKVEHLKLKRLLTETPIQQNGETEIKVTNGIAEYSDKRKTEINTAVCSLSEKLFLLKMTINRV